MKSVTLGPNTSNVEVTNVSSHGFWLYIDDRELFAPFNEFPWFRSASIGEIANVQLPTPHRLYWPQLDIDLAIESLTHPEKYPLMSSVEIERPPQQATPRVIEEEQANMWLAEARSLALAGHCESALVMAWAALEPAMRVAASAHVTAPGNVVGYSDGVSLIRMLVSKRIVTADWDKRLTELFRLRSAFAHGIRPVSLPAEADLRQAVESMLRLAEQLLSEAPRASREK